MVAGAVQSEDIELATKALKQKFASDNKYALSALYQAIINEQTDMAKLLINKGIQSPEILAIAAEQGHIDIIELLLNNDVDPKYGIVKSCWQRKFRNRPAFVRQRSRS